MNRLLALTLLLVALHVLSPRTRAEDTVSYKYQYYQEQHDRIEIRAQRQGDSVSIEVVDSGPGLPAGCEEKVFDKFFRGAHAGQSGAGLGLAICRGIAEAHGGSLNLANRKDRSGSEALLRLPR